MICKHFIYINALVWQREQTEIAGRVNAQSGARLNHLLWLDEQRKLFAMSSQIILMTNVNFSSI